VDAAELERSGQAQQVFPVALDQLEVDAVARQAIERAVVGSAVDTPEPGVADVGKPRCLVPESRDATLTREGEEALWQAVFTVQPEQRREFEPSSKRRKKRPAPWHSATA